MRVCVCERERVWACALGGGAWSTENVLKSTGKQHAMPCIGSVLNTNCNDDFDFILYFLFVLCCCAFFSFFKISTLANRNDIGGPYRLILCIVFFICCFCVFASSSSRYALAYLKCELSFLGIQMLFLAFERK